jgi:hypothetical protein
MQPLLEGYYRYFILKNSFESFSPLSSSGAFKSTAGTKDSRLIVAIHLRMVSIMGFLNLCL